MIINMQRYTFLHELYNKHHTFLHELYSKLYTFLHELYSEHHTFLHDRTSYYIIKKLPPCSALPSKGENKLGEIEGDILIY